MRWGTMEAVSEGDGEPPPGRRGNQRNRLAISVEVLSVLTVIAGAFLYLQYNGLSSLCTSVSNSDRCWKWEIRSDFGVGLMVAGVVGIVTGVAVGWLRRRG